MRTKKVFTCVVAALALMYSSGCCDAQGCYTVQPDCVQLVPCNTTVVKYQPAPAPVAIECAPTVVECKPAKVKRNPRLRKRFLNCETDPCADNPPLLFQTAAPAGTTVIAIPAGAVECATVECLPTPKKVECVPARKVKAKRAPAKKVDCVPVKATVQKTKVRGRTRTIIPVINNNVSSARGTAAAPVAPTYAVNMTGMKTQPAYLPGDATKATPAPAPATVPEKVGKRPAPEKQPEKKIEKKAAKEPEAPVAATKADTAAKAPAAPILPPMPTTPAAPSAPAAPVAKSGNPPLLSESPAPVAAAAPAVRTGPAVVSSPGNAASLEPIPYASPLDRSASGLQSVRGTSVMSTPAAQAPAYLPATATAPSAGPRSSTVEPWMLQRPEPVTASGFEPGALPPCPNPTAAGGCPPGVAPCAPTPAPCPPAAPAPQTSCPPSICPQPAPQLCLPSQGMSDCFTMDENQLMTSPRVLTPNAMTPLPMPPQAAMPPLPMPGQPQVQPAPSKYEALVPAARPQEFSRAEPKPAELSMPAPIGGNIPPVAPASEIESALDAMLSADGMTSVPGQPY